LVPGQRRLHVDNFLPESEGEDSDGLEYDGEGEPIPPAAPPSSEVTGGTPAPPAAALDPAAALEAERAAVAELAAAVAAKERRLVLLRALATERAAASVLAARLAAAAAAAGPSAGAGVPDAGGDVLRWVEKASAGEAEMAEAEAALLAAAPDPDLVCPSYSVPPPAPSCLPVFCPLALLAFMYWYCYSAVLVSSTSPSHALVSRARWLPLAVCHTLFLFGRLALVMDATWCQAADALPGSTGTAAGAGAAAHEDLVAAVRRGVEPVDDAESGDVDAESAPLANPLESLFEPEPAAGAAGGGGGGAGQAAAGGTGYSEDAIEAFSLDPGAAMRPPSYPSQSIPVTFVLSRHLRPVSAPSGSQTALMRDGYGPRRTGPQNSTTTASRSPRSPIWPRSGRSGRKPSAAPTGIEQNSFRGAKGKDGLSLLGGLHCSVSPTIVSIARVCRLRSHARPIRDQTALGRRSGLGPA
jgi:hypothetical protein